MCLIFVSSFFIINGYFQEVKLYEKLVNGDDKDFELKDLISKKAEIKALLNQQNPLAKIIHSNEIDAVIA